MSRIVKSEVITPLLSWDITVPLLTNRFMLFDFARWMLLTYGVMMLVACLIGLFARDLGVLWGVCQLFGLVCAGITVLFVVIMLIVFRNRMELAFVIDKDGVNALVASRRAKAGNRLAMLLGLLAGKPGVAGAGLLARAQENTRLEFAELRRVRFSPGPAVISLRDKWFRHVRLYCRPDNYAEVEKLVERGLALAASKVRPVRDPG
ncbi:hypothetical protein [Solidesulfovibrio magneticus]|uniref:Hypothetical membrane protein n=1 Tax=Solidesulfovibrio magneticus (strain ATCC 700980 / DSM 13731 / RS-1) TaxID=573370 RepID=C4XK51_SOLM1|nr:hypothetical protein [Solidesulfovibrio magneticus]BAH74406.1 hypothetical membrane protein [Solidesulfovibrio magneticus RS-1]